MNERIRELARQCYETGPIGRDGWPEYSRLNETKFAELIVRECVDIINYRADTCGDRLDSIKANEAVREGQRECAKTIKEHFGVEE